MMEQTNSCKCHCHTVLIARRDNILITNRSTRLCDIFHTGLMCTLDIITEREERI